MRSTICSYLGSDTAPQTQKRRQRMVRKGGDKVREKEEKGTREEKRVMRMEVKCKRARE